MVGRYRDPVTDSYKIHDTKSIVRCTVAVVVCFFLSFTPQHNRTTIKSFHHHKMPRFYDDYSSTYLTHDSSAGRKQQRRGWKFRENFKIHYEPYLDTWRKGPMGLASAQQGYIKAHGKDDPSIPPLPDGWKEDVDDVTGISYYMDTTTGKRTWVRPGFIPPPPGRGPPPPGNYQNQQQRGPPPGFRGGPPPPPSMMMMPAAQHMQRPQYPPRGPPSMQLLQQPPPPPFQQQQLQPPPPPPFYGAAPPPAMVGGLPPGTGGFPPAMQQQGPPVPPPNLQQFPLPPPPPPLNLQLPPPPPPPPS
jgi:WW domain/U1 zinc finger